MDRLKMERTETILQFWNELYNNQQVSAWLYLHSITRRIMFYHFCNQICYNIYFESSSYLHWMCKYVLSSVDSIQYVAHYNMRKYWEMAKIAFLRNITSEWKTTKLPLFCTVKVHWALILNWMHTASYLQ